MRIHTAISATRTPTSMLKKNWENTMARMEPAEVLPSIMDNTITVSM